MTTVDYGGGYRLTSHFSGSAYTLEGPGARSLYLQGDDAVAFEEERAVWRARFPELTDAYFFMRVLMEHAP